MSEVKLYFLEYLSIKCHFFRKGFVYGKNGVSVKNIKRYHYYIILKYAKTMTLKTFRRYLMVNFFFNEKFNVYSSKIDKSYMDAYIIYHSNVEYYFKRDIMYIKRNYVKIDYDILYNMYNDNKIFFFTIIDIYRKYKDKLKFNNENDKEKLNKYIHLEDKIGEKKR